MANSSIAERVKKRQDKDGMLRRSLERIVQLYTDKAHFIYELLQNAEDAGATKITFLQYPDRLVVIHDGRPFSDANLVGLCDIGKSDKINDLNQIGEFGVGFKSVFGICDTVRLYSHPNQNDLRNGYEQFSVEIQDFTNPIDIPDEEVNDGYTTRFVFPYSVGHTYSGFDTIDKLNKALSDRLQNLGITTLLFMKNLKSIDYRIDLPDRKASGTYLLDKKSINDHCAIVSAIGETGTNKKHEEVSYLVFSRQLDEKLDQRTIDIAFSVSSKDDGSYEFLSSKYPFISVYFPTETKSELKFIVQGPYRTTPNRSSVPNDSRENLYLAKKTAELLHDSIIELRDAGKLNYSLLNIFPLNEERFEASPLFHCVYDQTLEMMRDEDILVCNSGNYASATNVKIPRGTGFTEVFTDALLSELINDKVKYSWLPGYINEANAKYDNLYKYLTKNFNVGVIRPDSIRGLLLNNPQFLQKQSNEWLIKFYNMLESFAAIFGKQKGAANMMTVPFVKTEDGDFVAPYRNSDGSKDDYYIFAMYNGSTYLPNVFLPSKEKNNPGIKTVNHEIYNACKHFFKEILGLQVPDEYASFISSFKKRYESGINISDDQHITDLKHLLRYRKNPNYKDEIERLIEKYLKLRCFYMGERHYADPKTSKILFSENADGISLQAYYKHIKQYYYIDEQFYSIEDITRDDLISLGVSDDVSVGSTRTSGEYQKNTRGKQPEWSTLGEFRWKLSMNQINLVLEYISLHPDADDAKDKSRMILWFIANNLHRIRGTVYISGNNASLTNEFSDIVCLLRQDSKYKHMSYGSKWDGKWLYTASGQLVSQNEITRGDLDVEIYDGIRLSDDLFHILGFKKDKAEVLKEATNEYDQLSAEKQDQFFEIAFRRKFGISAKDFVKNFGDQISLFSSTGIASQQGDVFSFDDEAVFEFPTSRIKSWDSLKKHAAEALLFADPVKYQQKLRMIRVSRVDDEIKAYLQSMYRDGDSYQYACQMCHKPFKKIRICQLAKNMEKELDALYLSMCPICENKYKNLWNDEQLMRRFIKTIENLSDSDIDRPDMPVKINLGEESIWFTQTHIAEIRELLALEHVVAAQTDKPNKQTTSSANKGSRAVAKASAIPQKENRPVRVFRDERVKVSSSVREKPFEPVVHEEKKVKPGTDMYKKYIGKRIQHKTKGVGVIVSADDKYFGIRFDGAGNDVAFFSIATCLNKGLITMI